MKGYDGYSMSNNAVSAYKDGEKPLSRWTKRDILNSIEESHAELKCTMSMLHKVPVNVLKEACLTYSSWHHTSSYFNRTEFYSLDMDKVESLTDEDLNKLITDYKTKGKTNDRTEEQWKCSFLEWSGSRKHPKATEIVEIGSVKDGWFYRSNGSKKKTTANGFRFIEKIGG